MQAAVRGAVAFHQWSGQPPTIRRIAARFSHHVGARRGPPVSRRRLGPEVMAGVAMAFIVIVVALRGMGGFG